jgi:N-methylhydantoinase A
VGLPLQAPWVDVRSIGAGGGSIAYVDVGGLLKVGPRSAGAVPGPACYGRGGTEPTVTDAALVLGMLGEGVLASGIRLDREQARAALAPLGAQLGFDVEGVARGVMTIVTANMANQIREITVEQGQDPRRATLLSFGGAGPLFGTLLARELEVGRIVVPPYAGNFSAWGLLGADLTQSAARTRITKLVEGAVEEANAVLAELFATLEERAAGRDGHAGTAREVGLDMRYVGQEHTITIQVPSENGRIAIGRDAIRDLFTREYERTFAHTMDEEVEIVSLRATLRTPLPRRAEQRVAGAGSRDGRGAASAPAYSFTRGGELEFRILDRDALREADRLEGPAIVLEETATTYLDAGFEAKVDRSGCLFVSDMQEG